jgi:quercetin dioxygenase-like cupin family protein
MQSRDLCTLVFKIGSRGRLLRYALALGLIFCLGAPPFGQVQPSAIHRTTLQDEAFPPAPLHTVMIKTVIDVGGEVTPHSHPGLEMAYIVEGEATVTIYSMGPLALSAGGSFAVPPDFVHSVSNSGQGPLTVVSTYVVNQTLPISTPAS